MPRPEQRPPTNTRSTLSQRPIRLTNIRHPTAATPPLLLYRSSFRALPYFLHFDHKYTLITAATVRLDKRYQTRSTKKHENTYAPAK